MSNLLQKVFRQKHAQARKFQFAAREVAQIPRDDHIGPACNGQFDQVVISLIGQIGTPSVIQLDPLSLN